MKTLTMISSPAELVDPQVVPHNLLLRDVNHRRFSLESGSVFLMTTPGLDAIEVSRTSSEQTLRTSLKLT